MKTNRPFFMLCLIFLFFSVSPLMTIAASEVLTFITEHQSPTGKPLLLVANEVSGTIAAYELEKSPQNSNAKDQQTEGGNNASPEGNELPNTSTPIFTWMLVGLLIAGLGILIYIIKTPSKK